MRVMVQGAGCGWRCGVWVGMQAGMWGAGGLTESHLQGRAPGGGCRPGAGVRELRGACRGPFSVRDRAGQPRHGPLPTSGLPPATRPAFRSRAWPRYRPPRRLSPEERPGCSFATWAGLGGGPGCAHLNLKAQLTTSSPARPALASKLCACARQGPALPYWPPPPAPPPALANEMPQGSCGRRKFAWPFPQVRGSKLGGGGVPVCAGSRMLTHRTPLKVSCWDGASSLPALSISEEAPACWTPTRPPPASVGDPRTRFEGCLPLGGECPNGSQTLIQRRSVRGLGSHPMHRHESWVGDINGLSSCTECKG